LARAHGIAVWGEVELATRFIRQPIVAVTGTNGKTTVTTLIGQMLAASGRRVFVGGNIGTPLTDLLDQTDLPELVVAEISSFQLDTAPSFRPRVAVLLNITPDHLDRYDGMAEYARSKGRIFALQGPDEMAIYNQADPWVGRVVADLASRRLPFAHAAAKGDEVAAGALIHDDRIDCRMATGDAEVHRFSSLRLPGLHNRENAAAACLAALAAGGTTTGIAQALADFRGLPHRLEYVATKAGVDYYDDSKATNVDAVARALENFTAPLVLIMGGRDKKGDFETLRPLVRRHVRQLIVLGEAGPVIAATLGGEPRDGFRTAGDMSAAVRLAAASARRGESVLLSPACASFDMFTSYAHRGEVFCQAVRRLP
jgi:UDP-N-acetylmuramoylalanine--D-glutamate ligase